VAGIMAKQDEKGVAQMDSELYAFLKNLCPSLSRPFMTLSFMGLLVIPEPKLSDRGLPQFSIRMSICVGLFPANTLI